MVETLSQNYESAIAIIGMSGRFPGAKNIDEFWENLRDGVESIRHLSDEELLAAGVKTSLVNNPNYVKASAILENADCFDASFFEYSPREATLMDPQQRLFLECAWSALEHAGYTPEAYPGAIGIYGGTGSNSYLTNYLISSINSSFINPAERYELLMASKSDFLTTRVSYKLNLKGPSLNIQTACSTSLVALDLACEALLEGKCNIALAGGISLNSFQNKGYLYQEGLIASPDGHCRAFDAKAKGTVGGNGFGIVVLKCLEDALADRDTIHALIKGSATNNDGKSKIGFTAPSIEGQTAVISEAQEMAGVDPESITYIEAHGTATPLGDPIEITALTQAFQNKTEKKGFCAIGSVKTNIGHLNTAAGITGVIKTVLALKHKQIPPSLNFQSPNPKIDFANSPFFVNTKLTEWERKGAPRRAGVSSFGIGGTNAHVILEEWESSELEPKSDVNILKTQELLLLSAKTSTALEKVTSNLAHHLQQNSELNLADVAYTLSLGRQAFKHRRIAVVSHKNEDAADSLTSPDNELILSNLGQLTTCSVVFMFSGQGTQYVNMARELYETETYFQEQLDQCCITLQSYLGFDLREVLYPREDQTENATEKLKQTAIAQPALFVIEYALAQLWISWGIKPVAMIGHSIGEYVAATLAGVFSLEDALALVALRGQLMQSMQPGSMLAVPMAENEIKPLLTKISSLEVATVNGPANCVISGTIEAIENLERQLATQGIKGRLLHTTHGFHSYMMEPMLEPFTAKVRQIRLNPPKIPFVSNVTGTWIRTEEATNPAYYANHLRSCVRFADGVKQLFEDSEQVLLEVGPGNTLSTLVKNHSDKPLTQTILTSLRHPKKEVSDVTFLLKALGQLWLAGVEVDWDNYYGEEKRYRVPLPTYPFERIRYWIEPSRQTEQKKQIDGIKAKSLDIKPDIADWFYQPSWKRFNLPKKDKKDRQFPILLFVDELGLAAKLVKRLKLEGKEIITVEVGEKFSKVSELDYRLNPEHPHEYDVLIRELLQQKLLPKSIVHLWNITPISSLVGESTERYQDLGFFSLLSLSQALCGQNLTDKIEIILVHNHLQEVTGKQNIAPEKATLLGCIKFISQENPQLQCRSIDVDFSLLSSQQENQIVVGQLLKELSSNSDDSTIAYRHNHRWVQTFEPFPLEQPISETSKLKQGGIYFFTEGLEGIGLLLAEYLAKTVQAKLILTEDTCFPEREEWEKWLSNHNKTDKVSQKIEKAQKLEALGAEILVLSADITNQQQIRQAIAIVEDKLGKVDGVIHSAVLPGDRGAQNITRESIKAKLAHIIKGTLNLDSLFKDTDLDFFVCCSSLASIVGNFKHVDFCGSYSFLNTFALYQQIQGSNPITTINWDASPTIATPEETTNKQAEMKLAEVASVFQRILDHPIPQVIVSSRDLSSRTNEYNATQEISSDKYQEQTTRHQVKFPRPQLSNNYVAARNELEEKVVQIWQEFFKIKTIGIYDDFFELGGDSLSALQLITKLQKELHLNLSSNILLNSSTIESLCHIIQDNPQASSSTPDLPPCLVRLYQGNLQLQPLFLIHPIGGSVYFYRELAQELASEQSIYGIEAKGLEGGVDPLTTVEEMADYYIKSIRQLQPQGPYYLIGWSMGGLIAYEMTQQLKARKEPVALLTLIDSSAPAILSEPLELEQTMIVKYTAQYWAGLYGQKLGLSIETLNNLNPSQQLTHLLEKAQQQAIFSPETEIEQIQNLWKVFQTNLIAIHNYQPKAYSGSILLLNASETQLKIGEDTTYGWGSLVSGDIQTYTFAGNHYTILQAYQAKCLAKKIEPHLP